MVGEAAKALDKCIAASLAHEQRFEGPRQIRARAFVAPLAPSARARRPLPDGARAASPTTSGASKALTCGWRWPHPRSLRPIRVHW
ncbi:hypothetical protein NL676_017957 [Syzygium grande]|nr:hypothetical protein NL676_017957 [Syzygium grande]